MVQLNKELDKSIVDKLNTLILGDLNQVCDVWVAGGAILSAINQSVINDIDLFFTSENELKKAKDYIISNGGKLYHESDKVIKIDFKNLRFDLVKIYFESPLKCIQDFDFDICKTYVYKNELCLYGSFKQSFINRNLYITGLVKYPFSTLYRLQKYMNKGFNIDYASCKKIYDAIKNSTGIDDEEFYDNNVI